MWPRTTAGATNPGRRYYPARRSQSRSAVSTRSGSVTGTTPARSSLALLPFGTTPGRTGPGADTAGAPERYGQISGVHLGPSTFRHSAATMMLDSDLDLKTAGPGARPLSASPHGPLPARLG